MSVHVHSMIHQKEHGSAAYDGFRAHGINVQYAGRDVPTDADISVIWGWKQFKVIEHTEERGGRVLIMERGYLPDRMEWTAFGFDGLNGRARFADCQDAGERFERNWGHLVQPWQAGGLYALLCGQVPSDSSVKHIDIDKWMQETTRRLARLHPVVFRPHPVVLERFKLVVPDGAKRSKYSDLLDDLKYSRVCVTYNSNSAVDAVLAGVPSVATDEGSMAWPVTTHDIADAPIRPNRTDWMHRLAWSQFRIDEIRSGFAWEALKTAL